ncbi:MAG: thioredoxin family protein [Bacilli bacterium]|nr:thioredoxin family protein [Bacilli bacterium]
MIKVFNKNDSFENIVLEGKWIVDFNATWCMPCRMMESVLDELADVYNILKVDIDQFSELAMEYDVLSVPTLIFFVDGVVSKKHVGLVSSDDIKELFK